MFSLHRYATWNSCFLENTQKMLKWRMIITVNFPMQAIGKKKPEKKNQGFNGIRTRDLPDTSAMLYQLSYDVKYIWNIYFIYTSHHFTPHGRYELTKLASLPTCVANISYIPHIISLLTGDMNSLNWSHSQPVWLHSSVGRASHRYRGGHGFESRWSLDFFSGFFFPIA